MRFHPVLSVLGLAWPGCVVLLCDTATSVSSELKIALFVAQVELAACEKNGLVVRDSHYDGTVFFLNAF